mmetsp:Transcript_47609/g.97338  ORF Transcript_47609/g.97338 Transcript_47609/m.97338 type:complete len:97 (+) Transcript_47609:122-412(+)
MAHTVAATCWGLGSNFSSGMKLARGTGCGRSWIAVVLETKGQWAMTNTDWLVLCGKNSAMPPNNFISDGKFAGDARGGCGNQELHINLLDRPRAGV